MKKLFISILLSSLLIQTALAEGYYYFYDHIGNVDVITDESGEAVSDYDYDPYGETIEENVYDDDFENDYKYTGQEEDDESGLYYYHARYYNPGLGRFTSQDPAVYDNRLFEMLEDPQSLNPYAYARNNPVKYVDPSGEYNVETGVIEEGDTKNGIVDTVNKTLGITTDWATIATVSFFDADKSINDLVAENEFIACGTDYVANITDDLDSLNESRSDEAISGNFGLITLASLFKEGGSWDLKNSYDLLYNSYRSYIYHGKLIRYDAPGNINFGYVMNKSGYSFYTTSEGAHWAAGFWGDNAYDQQMIKHGYFKTWGNYNDYWTSH